MDAVALLRRTEASTLERSMMRVRALISTSGLKVDFLTRAVCLGATVRDVGHRFAIQDLRMPDFECHQGFYYLFLRCRHLENDEYIITIGGGVD